MILRPYMAIGGHILLVRVLLITTSVDSGVMNGIIVTGIDKRTGCYAVVHFLLTWIDFNNRNTS